MIIYVRLIKTKGEITLKECSKLLIEIVSLFEEYDFEYAITESGRVQIDLGGEFFDVDKTNVDELKELLEDLQTW